MAVIDAPDGYVPLPKPTFDGLFDDPKYSIPTDEELALARKSGYGYDTGTEQFYDRKKNPYADLFLRAALMAGRIPVAALGSIPHNTYVGPFFDGVRGEFHAGENPHVFVNSFYNNKPATLTHENIHSGLNQIREHLGYKSIMEYPSKEEMDERERDMDHHTAALYRKYPILHGKERVEYTDAEGKTVRAKFTEADPLGLLTTRPDGRVMAEEFFVEDVLEKTFHGHEKGYRTGAITDFAEQMEQLKILAQGIMASRKPRGPR